MKPPIVFEVYDHYPGAGIAGRITGSNIHVGDIFTEAKLKKLVSKDNDHYKYEYSEIFSGEMVEILSIEAYSKKLEWLHAPYGAGLKIQGKYLDLIKEYVNGIETELGIVELTGPYSEKSDTTGGGRWT